MTVDPATAAIRRTIGGRDYYFSSEHCVTAFDAAPERQYDAGRRL